MNFKELPNAQRVRLQNGFQVWYAATRIGQEDPHDEDLAWHAFLLGIQLAESPDLVPEASLDRFEALLVRMEHLAQARASVDRCHPTRARLLEAIDWALSDKSRQQCGRIGSVLWCAELKRVAGL